MQDAYLTDSQNTVGEQFLALAHGRNVVSAERRRAMLNAGVVGIAVALIASVIAIVFHLKLLQWSIGTWKVPLIILSLAILGPIGSILCGIGAGLVAFIRMRPSEQGVPVVIDTGSLDIEELFTRAFEEHQQVDDAQEVADILRRSLVDRQYQSRSHRYPEPAIG